MLADPQDGGEVVIAAGMDRNGYGRQAYSFHSTLEATILGRDFPGVFMRAPRFAWHSESASVAAMHGQEVVGVRTGNRLALTFHPELSSDPGFHRWLIETAAGAGSLVSQSGCRRCPRGPSLPRRPAPTGAYRPRGAPTR